jgi:mannose-6-phosphate isomerase-like protein (cupin superfamily)
MKQIKDVAISANYHAVSFGNFSELNEFVMQLGPDIKIPGKVFGGKAVEATGCEFSFQEFLPGSESGFLHTHKNHEELYFCLSGQGEFQVDGDIFKISEGSVVRVSPKGERSIRNNGNIPLMILCVQYCGNTFTDADATDGVILNKKVAW